MRLVFVTQVLDADDAILGFVTRWVEGLARATGRVRVLALEVGRAEGLGANVDVREIGRRGHLARWLRYRSYLTEAFDRDGFDTLLTHMVPRYSSVAAGLARRRAVGHFLWYTHKGVDARLRRAVGVVDKVFTASDESMRVATPKKVVTGHGIDLEHFDASGAAPERPPRLLGVGRLTESKDVLTTVEGLARLVAAGHDVSLDWVGGVRGPGDREYLARVQHRVRELDLRDRVRLQGERPYPEVPADYRRATLLVSTSRTGSVDKVVLEAMACGRPVVTCNESFPPILAELGDDAADLVFPPGDAAALAQRVAALLGRDQASRDALGARLRALVRRDHEVDALMRRLVLEMGGPA